MSSAHRRVAPGSAGYLRGFTLIELLVVVAVIGILASILLPALSGARQKATRTACLSNLKQIGTAIMMYTDDNEGSLPGPCFTGARASYDRNSSTELIWYIAEFLGQPPPGMQTVVAEVFVCPGYLRSAPGLTSMIGRKCYLLNDNVPEVFAATDDASIAPASAGGFRPPFGYPAQAGSPAIKPLKLTNLSANRSTSDIWAITDVDKVNVPNPRITWWDDLPYKPVHGAFRNELYFDGHVSPRKVEY